jgi:hypothetical protein
MLLFVYILFIGNIIMVFDANAIVKKIQYITIDSEFIKSSNTTVGGYSMGGNNNFSVNFGTSSSNVGGVMTQFGSNIFIQEMRNVIGLKVVDFYVTQIGSFELGSDNTSDNAVKYIDILCPTIPDSAQILDERKSRIFARVPLERDFSGTSNIIANDKQWKSFNRQTNYFNPLSIKQLNFQLWEMTGPTNPSALPANGNYQPLQPDASFYMILEVTTIDNEVVTLPKEDPTLKVVGAIESLENKLINIFEQFPDLMKSAIPVPVLENEVPIHSVPSIIVPESESTAESVKPKIIDKKMYWIIAIILLLIAYYFMDSKK